MAPAMKRTILERFDVPDSNYESVMLLFELPPGVNTGLHTHPGFDVVYLIEGDITVITLGSGPIKTVLRIPRFVIHGLLREGTDESRPFLAD